MKNLLGFGHTKSRPVMAEETRSLRSTQMVTKSPHQKLSFTSTIPQIIASAAPGKESPEPWTGNVTRLLLKKEDANCYAAAGDTILTRLCINGSATANFIGVVMWNARIVRNDERFSGANEQVSLDDQADQSSFFSGNSYIIMVKRSTLSLTLTSRTDAADRKQCFSKEKTLYGRKESFLRNTPSYFMFAKDLFSL